MLFQKQNTLLQKKSVFQKKNEVIFYRANLFFLPFASKLKSVILAQSAFREMVVEGVVAIAEGENPRNIETRLMGYVQ